MLEHSAWNADAPYTGEKCIATTTDSRRTLADHSSFALPEDTKGRPVQKLHMANALGRDNSKAPSRARRASYSEEGQNILGCLFLAC